MCGSSHEGFESGLCRTGCTSNSSAAGLQRHSRLPAGVRPQPQGSTAAKRGPRRAAEDTIVISEQSAKRHAREGEGEREEQEESQ